VTVTVKGNPTPEELAAALAVLMGRGVAPQQRPDQPVSRWADRQGHLRRHLPHGPGAWRHAL
jgi:hypothetical protein